ncbi:MAG TPA: hypothetical protein VHU24_04210 [Solirubrobacterales bacterium]|nr:hypothetical protein [Solirubrobacterales bacterium]
MFEAIENVLWLDALLLVGLPEKPVEALVALGAKHGLGELGPDEAPSALDVAARASDAGAELFHRPGSDGELEAEILAELDEATRGIDFVGGGGAENRVEEVGVEVYAVAFELGVDELLGARVNRQDRHVEAGVEQAGEEAALVGGWSANEERKCAGAERVKPTLTLRKPIEALGIDGVEETTGTVLLGVEHHRGLGTMPSDDQMEPSTQVRAEQSDLVFGEAGSQAAYSELPLTEGAVLDLLGLSCTRLELSKRLGGELEAAAGFGGGAGCDQVFDDGTQLVDLDLKPPEVGETAPTIQQRRNFTVVDAGDCDDEIVKDGTEVEPAPVPGTVLSETPDIGDSLSNHEPKNLTAAAAVPAGTVCRDYSSVGNRKNLVPKLVPDSTELSRTPWT